MRLCSARSIIPARCLLSGRTIAIPSGANSALGNLPPAIYAKLDVTAMQEDGASELFGVLHAPPRCIIGPSRLKCLKDPDLRWMKEGA